MTFRIKHGRIASCYFIVIYMLMHCVFQRARITRSTRVFAGTCFLYRVLKCDLFLYTTPICDAIPTDSSEFIPQPIKYQCYRVFDKWCIQTLIWYINRYINLKDNILHKSKIRSESKLSLYNHITQSWHK